MRVSIHTIMQLSVEQQYILRTIWHPEEGDAFFLLDPLSGPNNVLTYTKKNHNQFAEDRLNAYPLFTIEQMMKTIEDYGGYNLYIEVVHNASSINELFTLLWETIVGILEDGESAQFWTLTIPVTERQVLEFDLPIPL